MVLDADSAESSDPPLSCRLWSGADGVGVARDVEMEPEEVGVDFSTGYMDLSLSEYGGGGDEKLATTSFRLGGVAGEVWSSEGKVEWEREELDAVRVRECPIIEGIAGTAGRGW